MTGVWLQEGYGPPLVSRPPWCGRLRRAIAASLVIAVAVGPPLVAQTYRVIDITSEFKPSDINNRLQMVGSRAQDPFAIQGLLWEANALRTLPHIRDAWTLLINDAGTIAGTRFVDGTRRDMAAFETDADGSYYIERALPRNATGDGVTLTESGILLIKTSFLESAGRQTGTGYFALYRSQLYDLREVFGLGTQAAIRAIDDAGRIGGTSASGSAFLETLDRSLATPWNEGGSVEAMGAAGHVAGFGQSGGGSTLNVRHPDGSVARLPLFEALSSTLLRINRAGDLVGSFITAARVDPVTNFNGFVYREGRLIDLNTPVTIDRERVSHAVDITDSGVILARTSFQDFFLTNRSVLLVPAAPLPPRVISYGFAGGTAFITWAPSAAAIDYVLEAGSAPGASDVFRSSIGLATSASGAVPPGRYYVRVRARGAEGVSPASPDVVIEVR